jgi:NAD-dependent deacetylase
VIDGLAPLVDLFASSVKTVVLTGAGISTESGIPDFRSQGGVWSRFDATELTYARFLASVETRRRYWDLGRELYPIIRQARPNGAHTAIATIARRGRLDACITQNVDGLHQRAGLPADRVIELHGNATQARCLQCTQGWSRDEVHRWPSFVAGEIPDCPHCGGIVKPTTILFGEPMPHAELAEAERRARAADLFIAVGSSLAVYPAAYLPRHARHAGARLAIVNLSPTPCDNDADVLVRGSASEVLQALVEEVPTRV